MTQDADYLTNDQYPHQPDQGIGLDQTAINITTSTTSTAVAGSLPDLAASSVVISKSTVQWGSTFQASTEVQNVGAGPAPPSTVFFILTGQSGSLTDAIFLGETTIPALASGASQQINQTLQLPITLPAGVTLNSVGYARVEVLTNPENDFNESVYSNGGALIAAVHRQAAGQRHDRADFAGRGHAPLDSRNSLKGHKMRQNRHRRAKPPRSSQDRGQECLKSTKETAS